MKLRVTYRERTTGGGSRATNRQTCDIAADATVETVGGFLVFRNPRGAVVLMVPEVCTDSVERVGELVSEPMSVPHRFLPGRLDAVLTEIADERGRQDVKWGEQNHPMVGFEPPGVGQVRARGAAVYYRVTTADIARTNCGQAAAEGNLSWTDILLEEFCEFLEAAAQGDDASARVELKQLAAVAVAAIEAHDRRTGDDSAG